VATSPLFFLAAASLLAAITAFASRRRHLVVARVTNVPPDRPAARSDQYDER
jgi:hypothetical protein